MLFWSTIVFSFSFFLLHLKHDKYFTINGMYFLIAANIAAWPTAETWSWNTIVILLETTNKSWREIPRKEVNNTARSRHWSLLEVALISLLVLEKQNLQMLSLFSFSPFWSLYSHELALQEASQHLGCLCTLYVFLSMHPTIIHFQTINFRDRHVSLNYNIILLWYLYSQHMLISESGRTSSVCSHPVEHEPWHNPTLQEFHWPDINRRS